MDAGSSVLVLTDRGVDADHAPIPALLAVGAVHHHLLRVGKRALASLVVESGEPRDIHHFATLVGYGAAAVHPDRPLPPELAELFPALVDSIIVQADLTAVAGGPLPYQLAAELRLLAAQESRGGAGVYRFSAESLRRAFDAGWSAERIRDWLSHHSATTIPQPLS